MSDFTCIFVYCLTVTAFICIYECKHTTYTAEMCGSFTFCEYLLLQCWSPRGETAKLPQKLLKKKKIFGLYSKFYRTSLLIISHSYIFLLFCPLFYLSHTISSPSSLPSRCVVSKHLSVWHSLTLPSCSHFINMMSRVSPFQRASPADTADYADHVIWRRLKVLEHFWFLFCLRML